MQQGPRVKDPRQEEARENAVKAPRILPREAWEAGAEAEVRARVKAEVVAEARVEAEAPVRAVATVNI